MKKPRELRDFLTSNNPHLRNNPDTLHVFVDKGVVVSTGTRSLSHEYRYDLNLIVTDYAGTPDSIMLPILVWLRTNQSELFDNPNKREEGIRLEIDVLTHDTVDVSITLPLTERVIVAPDESGKMRATHVAEPPHPDLTPDDETANFYMDGELIATLHQPGWNPKL